MAEQAAESFASDDFACSDRRVLVDRSVADALMRPFSVVVLGELADGSLEMAGAEQDQPAEALPLDGRNCPVYPISDPPAGQATQTGCPDADREAPFATTPRRSAGSWQSERRGVFRIAGG